MSSRHLHKHPFEVRGHLRGSSPYKTLRLNQLHTLRYARHQVAYSVYDRFFWAPDGLLQSEVNSCVLTGPLRTSSTSFEGAT